MHLAVSDEPRIDLPPGLTINVVTPAMATANSKLPVVVVRFLFTSLRINCPRFCVTLSSGSSEVGGIVAAYHRKLSLTRHQGGFETGSASS
jgi:hypothetical protein